MASRSFSTNGIRSTSPLPLTVERLTPEWFSTILGQKVNTTTVIQAIHSTASKILIELVYDDACTAAPTSICVKAGFNPEVLKLHPSLSAVYQLEAEFYRFIAPNSSMRLPRSFYSGIDLSSGQGLVVLEDLSASGNTFGDPVKPWPVERVRAGVAQLARLHGETWGRRAEDYPYLSTALSLRDVITSMMSPPAWASRFDGTGRPPVPDHMADRDRIVAAFKTLWRTTDPRMWCMLHGDAHIGNTYITPTGEPGFLDWQGLHFGSAIHDVAELVTGALTVGDRRMYERDIYRHYLDELRAMGGPNFSTEEVWDEYRKQQLHGFAWTLAPPSMQPKECVDAMTMRHCAAIEDHKTLELLEGMDGYVRE